MSERNAEFEGLLATAIDGRADEAQIEQLRVLLRQDAGLRAEYAAQLQLHALLHWRSGTVSTNAKAAEGKLIPFRSARVQWWIAAAAAIVAAAGAALWFSQPATRPQTARNVEFEVIEAVGVVATDGSENYREGARLALSRLQMQSGMLRFRLSSGAVVTVNGPADVQLLDPMRLRVGRGQLTADVGDNAKGFVVETAQTHVVDLGTKFGVDVADSGHTDVVVFKGEVELFDRKGHHRSDALMSRLVEGEAVRVDERQQLSRIVNVTSAGPREEEWSTRDRRDSPSIIALVRDNLRDPQAKYFYRIVPGGLQEDAPAFIGQRHEWNGLDANGIPPWLLGADLVQTFMSDRFKTQLEITVTVAHPAVIYVFFDNRHNRPAWLTEHFTDTGAKIGLENAPTLSSGLPVEKGSGAGHMATCTIWKCELPHGGSITLGPPREVGDEREDQKPYWNWMYGIAAKPLAEKQ